MASKASHTQIVGTIGPASRDRAVLTKMIEHHLDVARLNFSWGTFEEHAQYIADIRAVANECGRRIPIIQDVPGPRVQDGAVHSLDTDGGVVTEEDQRCIAFGVEQKVDYIAVSFVRDADDIAFARTHAGDIPLIAKIERPEALENIEGLCEAADGIMIARGDLGDNIPLEKIPFVQVDIINHAHAHKKPVITATEMLLSMTHKQRPTRAEVTDVAYAILNGSDGVMLSEETAAGDYPVETVSTMERIIYEAEQVHGTTEQTIYKL